MKKFWKTLLLILALILVPSYSTAQVPSIPAGTAFFVEWDHDGLYTTHFTVSLDGTIVHATLPVPAGSGLRAVRAPIAAIASLGQHRITVAAVGPGGNTTGFIDFDVVPPTPMPPANLRVTITISQAADGSFNLRIDKVETLPTLRMGTPK